MHVQARAQIEKEESKSKYTAGQDLWREKILSYDDLLSKNQMWQNPAFKNQYEFRPFYTADGKQHYYELFQNGDGSVHMSIDSSGIQIGTEELSSQKQLLEADWEKKPVLVSVLLQNARVAMHLDDPQRTGKAPSGIIEYEADKGNLELHLNGGYVYEPGGLFSAHFTSAREVADKMIKQYAYEAEEVRYKDIPEEIVNNKEPEVEELTKAVQENAEEIEKTGGADLSDKERKFKAYTRGAYENWNGGKSIKERILSGIKGLGKALKGSGRDLDPDMDDPENNAESVISYIMDFHTHKLLSEQAKIEELTKKADEYHRIMESMQTRIRNLSDKASTTRVRDQLDGLHGREESMHSAWQKTKSDIKQHEAIYKKLQESQERNTAYFDVYKDLDVLAKGKEAEEIDKAAAMVERIRMGLKAGHASVVIGNIVHQGKLHLITGKKEIGEDGEEQGRIYIDGKRIAYASQLYGHLASFGGHTYPDYNDEMKQAQKYLADQKLEFVGLGRIFPPKVSVILPGGETISAFARIAAPDRDSNGKPSLKWNYMSLGKHMSPTQVREIFNGARAGFGKLIEQSAKLSPEGAKQAQAFMKARQENTRTMELLQSNFIDFNRANMESSARQDRTVIFMHNGSLHTARFTASPDNPASFSIDGKEAGITAVTNVEAFTNFMDSIEDKGNRSHLDMEAMEREAIDKELTGEGKTLVIKIPADFQKGNGYDTVKISVQEGELSYKVNGKEKSREGTAGVIAKYNKMADAVIKAVKENDRQEEKNVPVENRNLNQDAKESPLEQPSVDPQPVFHEDPFPAMDEDTRLGTRYYDDMAQDYASYTDVAENYIGTFDRPLQETGIVHKEPDAGNAHSDLFMEGFSINNNGRNSSNPALMAYQINCEYFDKPDHDFENRNSIYTASSKPFIVSDRFGQPEHEFRKYKDEEGQWKITDVSESSHGPFISEMNMDQFRSLIGKMTTPGNPLYSKTAAMDIQKQLTAGSRQADFIKSHEKDPVLKAFSPVVTGKHEAPEKSNAEIEWSDKAVI